MASRGVWQLKRLRFTYCDIGGSRQLPGSSKTMRRFLTSDEFKSFREQNEQFDYEVVKRRGRHPNVSALYINGFIKDLPAIGKSTEDLVAGCARMRNSCRI